MSNGKCECEYSGAFYSGVPGITAAMENGKVVSGTEVERCDACKRYPDDKTARAKMAALGLLGAVQ